MSGAVVVTGASGFIGRHVVAALLAGGHDVVGLTRQRSRLDDLTHARLRIAEVDYSNADDVARQLPEGSSVVHLAAVRNAPGSTREALVAANVTATLRLAEASMRKKVRRFVCVSTALVLWDPLPGAPSDPYAESKRRGLEALEEMEEDLPLVTILPTIVYGPDWPRARSRLTEHMRSLLRRPLRIGIGSNAPRNLVYVDDVVQAIVNAESASSAGGRTIVGGENATQDDFELAVFRVAGRPATPRVMIPPVVARALASATDGVLRIRDGCGWRGRVSMLMRAWALDPPAGGVVPTPLEEGIARTVRFIREERP